MCADGIAHGINLAKSTVLEYAYYIAQIPCSVSPVSNNYLFLDYIQNPFSLFFKRGLNVSLATDNPLYFHFTREPLLEEYSIAHNVFKLSMVDMCEISRNSILHSGFPHSRKKECVSNTYWLPGPSGNDTSKTNVPPIRVAFRSEVLSNELDICGIIS